MKIHLDTDLGSDIDDLCALAMLLKWPGGVEITGITTVARMAGGGQVMCGMRWRVGVRFP